MFWIHSNMNKSKWLTYVSTMLTYRCKISFEVPNILHFFRSQNQKNKWRKCFPIICYCFMKIKYYSLLDFVLELCSKAFSFNINKQLSTFNKDAPKLNFWTILFPKWRQWVRNSLLVRYQSFTKVRFHMWNLFMSSICSYQPEKMNFISVMKIAFWP